MADGVPVAAAEATQPRQRAWVDALLLGTLAAAIAAAVALELLRRALPPAFVAALLVLLALAGLRALVLARTNRRLAAGFAASDDFKTQLLRFISHEIGNPLSPLKVQVRLLRQNLAQDLEKAWQTVDRSIGRLESLSRDVRLMALAETHRIVQSTKEADLVPRVAAAVQAHQGVAAQRGITLAGEMPAYAVTVPVDGERFDQVVDNLLSNALKFTPKEGRIDVRVWRAPGGVSVVEVQDSGAGMDAAQQARLFSAFGRPQGSTTPGLGLGLYLCKAIVDGHGGRLTATSDGPGMGSRFRIELPPGRPPVTMPDLGPRPAYAPREQPQQVPEGRPPDLPL